jgi:hypothetical protein
MSLPSLVRPGLRNVGQGERLMRSLPSDLLLWLWTGKKGKTIKVGT